MAEAAMISYKEENKSLKEQNETKEHEIFSLRNEFETISSQLATIKSELKMKTEDSSDNQLRNENLEEELKILKD